MEGIPNIDISEVEGEEDIENLIENYGTLTLEQVARWEGTCIAIPSRAAQDTYMPSLDVLLPHGSGKEEDHDLV